MLSSNTKIPQTQTISTQPIAQKLDRLLNIRALPESDRHFIAILQTRPEGLITAKELQQLADMWRQWRGES